MTLYTYKIYINVHNYRDHPWRITENIDKCVCILTLNEHDSSQRN